MELEVKTLSGGASGKVAVGFELIESSKGNQAVHDVVVAYTAAQRSGTAKTKDRGEVSGTGKKAVATKKGLGEPGQARVVQIFLRAAVLFMALIHVTIPKRLIQKPVNLPCVRRLVSASKMAK